MVRALCQPEVKDHGGNRNPEGVNQHTRPQRINPEPGGITEGGQGCATTLTKEAPKRGTASYWAARIERDAENHVDPKKRALAQTLDADLKAGRTRPNGVTRGKIKQAYRQHIAELSMPHRLAIATERAGWTPPNDDGASDVEGEA